LVSRAIAVLRDQQETDSMRLALEMHRTSALAGIDTLLEPGRAARAARLEQELATSLQRFATRAKRIAREGPLSKCDLIWSRTMGSTALTVAVLHLQAVNEGFGGYRLQQRDLARLRQALAACNRQDLFPAFRRLLATRPASQFYKTYLRLSASRSPMGAAFEPIRPALPRIRLDRAGVTPLADPSVSLASWRERRVEFPVLLGREFVPFVTMAGDAASVEQASLPPPGPMVLRLRRPGDWSWHAHVRGAGLPIWATTEWGDPPSPTDGCVVTLPSAVVGSVLEIRFNFDDAECAEPDERGASPCASGAAVRLVLSRPSGSVAAPDGRTIYWEIVSGWPQPPVAASGGGQ
jgi:hypothetical protein